MNSPEARTPLRYLVLGSTGYGGVDSVDWIEGELPNIVDYDTIIIDVPSLTYDKLDSADLKRFKLIEKNLIRFLFSGGNLIIISDRIITNRVPERYPETITNYYWCPINLSIQNEKGKSILIKSERFRNYIAKLSEWDYYINIPYSWKGSELIDNFGPDYKTKYKIICLPIVVNRYDKNLAVSYQIQIRNPRRKEVPYGSSYNEYPQIPDYVTGDIIVLPRIFGIDNRKAVNLLLEEITGNPQQTLPPQWADELILPGASSLINQIDEKRQQIQNLETEINRLKGEIDSLNEYKLLLYATGTELENIVKRCFMEIGGQVKPAKYAEEEFVLIYKGIEYLVEVKGVSKSIALSHLRQLNDYLLKYQEDTGQICKGIIFGNPWCTLPPQDRDQPEITAFPNNVIKRAEQWDIALISSNDFYQAFTGFLEHGHGDSILDAITTQKGIVKFF